MLQIGSTSYLALLQWFYFVDALPHHMSAYKPVPLPSATNILPITFLTSDDLCFSVFAPWIIFLRDLQFPVPANEAVESTEVDVHKVEGDEDKDIITRCLDVRSYIQWARVNEYMQRIRNQPNYVHMAPKWYHESSVDGPWIYKCPDGTNAVILPKRNKLHQEDTFGECLDFWDSLRRKLEVARTLIEARAAQAESSTASGSRQLDDREWPTRGERFARTFHMSSSNVCIDHPAREYIVRSGIVKSELDGHP